MNAILAAVALWAPAPFLAGEGRPPQDLLDRLNKVVLGESISVQVGANGVGPAGRVAGARWLAWVTPDGEILLLPAAGRGGLDGGLDITRGALTVAGALPPGLGLDALRDGKAPIRPGWIATVMGLARYGPARDYRLEKGGRELVRRVTAPNGRRLREVAALSGDGDTCRVAGHRLEDADGGTLCVLTIDGITTRSDRWTEVPLRLRVEWPGSKEKITLYFGGVRFNAPRPAW